MRAVLALLASGIFASGTAAADVRWTAPSGCPSAAGLNERIDRRLPDTMSVAMIDTAIAVTVTRAGAQFVATIDTRAISAAGQGRTLTAARCDELADAVALIIARLAIDVQRAVAPTRDANSTRVADDQPASAIDSAEIEMPAEAVVRPRIAASRRPIAWTGGMRVLALSGIGMTPDVGIGADLSAFVQRDEKFVELGVAKWAPRPMYLLPGGVGQVDFGVQLVALRAGWASAKMPLRGWVGVELGSMRGEGMALRTPESGTGRWVAIASGFGVGWPLSPRTRVVGTFEVAVPIERAKFTFMDGTEVREPAPISARSALGVELAWR